MTRFSKVFILIFLGTFTSYSQYTETINSNRPGNSQGAFSVGRGVLQFEAGAKLGEDKHSLLKTEAELWGIDYMLRYGFYFEQLEINIQGTFLDRTTSYLIGANTESFHLRNFESNAIGIKYLFYDPHKEGVGREVSLYSWKANQKFDWSVLIPAVSLYAGANFSFGDNPYLLEEQAPFSPRVALITQNNWGPWVLVMNFIGDRLVDSSPTYSGIVTLTHSVTPRFALFGEIQVLMSRIYSDELLRGGMAYLFHKNFQADISGLINFKDTPSRWQVAAGLSYRFDWHTQDEFLEDETPL